MENQQNPALQELQSAAANLRQEEMERAWSLRLRYNNSCMSFLPEDNKDCFWVFERILASRQTRRFQWGVTRNSPFAVNHDRAHYMSLFREQMDYDGMSSEQIDHFQATASVPGWFRAPPNSLSTADAPPMNTTSTPPLAAFNAALELNLAATFLPWTTHDLVPPGFGFYLVAAGVIQARAPASFADYSIPPTPCDTPARSNTPMAILPDSELDTDWVVPPTPYNSPQKSRAASMPSTSGTKSMLPPPTPFNSPDHSRSASPIWVVTPIGTRSNGTKLTPSSSYLESPFQRKAPELSSALLQSSDPEKMSPAKGDSQLRSSDLPPIPQSPQFRSGDDENFRFGGPDRPTLPHCPQLFGDDENFSGA